MLKFKQCLLSVSAHTSDEFTFLIVVLILLIVVLILRRVIQTHRIFCHLPTSIVGIVDNVPIESH